MKYDTYQRLSWKTFFITLAQNCLTAIAISFIWFLLVIIKTVGLDSILTFQNSSDSILPLTKILDLAVVFGLIIVLFSWLIAIASTLIRHLTFYFMVDEHGITIKEGLIHKTETTTPHRHIENIDINQPLIYRLFGMCQLHILTGEEEGDNSHGHDSEIKFPLIEKIYADEIKGELFTHLQNFKKV
jgi:uncharacterized membrane protein YdbT with pleckstrin-like domain